MAEQAEPRVRRVVPTLVMGGILILLLSWLAFMVHYITRESEKRAVTRQSEAPAPVPTNAVQGGR